MILFCTKSDLMIFFFFFYKNICCGYSLEACHQGEALLMSTHSIYFHREIKKKTSVLFEWKSNLIRSSGKLLEMNVLKAGQCKEGSKYNILVHQVYQRTWRKDWLKIPKEELKQSTARISEVPKNGYAMDIPLQASLKNNPSAECVLEGSRIVVQ